ncbi:alpha/beta hydrolase family protein [Rufibacter psychrotolerans]|uniref:alpha/beta hydrolase family protein n=1 Tax=Rufibacter psychrotolerans TaxID=2812556 RepID=UPI001967D3F7|nr:acetylxylan esterase [Rufibacter sp. SYSU D00308]
MKKFVKSLPACFPAAFLLLALANGPHTQAQVLPFKGQTVYNAYLVRHLHEAYDQRRAALEQALASPAQMQAYQAKVKEEYLRVLGTFPQKQPLNARITRTIKQNGFRVENLTYESRPNHHVTANLYIPEGKGPFPAVLLLNGHEMTAKATESYQKTARLFATHGFVVLSVDPFSQGERVQLTDAAGKTLTRGATTEHTLLNAGANLVGTSVAAYMLWDNVRGLDYLETRPEVDKTRFGAIGNSGGGTQTIYLTAFDDRIKAAAPCSYFTQRERYIEVAGSQDGCQYMPGEGNLEMADFIIAAAPKPVLVLAGENDFVDHRGTLQGFKELQQVYRTLQQPTKVELFVWPDGHGISQPKREVAVTWFRKWFYQDDTPIKEGNIGSLPEKDLLATPSGQVNTAFAQEATVQALNQRRFQDLARERQAFLAQQDKTALKTKVREVIGLQLNSTPVFTEVTDASLGKGYRLEKRVLMRTGELPVPAMVYTPTGKGKPSRIRVHLTDKEKGKESLAKNDSLIQKEMAAGTILVFADLRGVGETKDDPKLNDAKYWSSEYRNAVLSLHLKRPLLGQRVQDVVTLLDYLKAQQGWENLPVHLEAEGVYGPVVTHAAFLDERITQATIGNAITTYEAYLRNPLQKDMYSNVVQGILQYYDLPDLVKQSAGRIKQTQL